MLEFKRLGLRDIEKVRPYFSYSVNRICDNTTGGAFMWRDYFSVEYAEFNETIIFKAQVKYHDNITAFSMPLGKDVYGSINEIVEYCRRGDLPVAFCTVTQEDIRILSAVFPDFRLSMETDWNDYVYRAGDLVSLSGRKYSGQRNHINHFVKICPNYGFEEISDDNLQQVKYFYAGYIGHISLNPDTFAGEHNKTSEVFAEEHNKTLEVLDNYRAYGLVGGLLRVDGSVIAFSIGEVVNSVLFVHIEKAFPQCRGAYQVMAHEFAKHFAHPGVDFINREEDVGDEGLRASKLSYHPCEIIEKYIFSVA